MGRFLRWLFGTTAQPAPPPAERREPVSLFNTHKEGVGIVPRRTTVPVPSWPGVTTIEGRGPNPDGTGMDDQDVADSVKATGLSGYTGYGNIPDAQMYWYASQSFIGYQMMSMLMQNWLIDKACSMPAKDAVRKGFDLSVDDGTDVEPDVLDYIREMDESYRLNWHMIEYIRKGRGFGIRLMLFVVESPDPDYYVKPFNIDGILPYSYKGMSQIDPYWMTPQLLSTAVTSPGNIDFYKPEFWKVGTQVIHRSHFVIFTTGDVPDVLKPAYNFGGVSVTQRIFERVYAAERTANEAPLLTMTKRSTILYTDTDKAMANQAAFDQRLETWASYRDNWQVKVQDTEDKLEQFDITLNDLDSVIMTQYQLVAAIADVPGTKLLGTQPKGFNSTGEFEESSYHEMLESLQNNDLNPMLRRHHALLIMSHVVPKFGIKRFKLNISWNELDALTEQEKAAVNVAKLQGDEIATSLMAIDAQEVRDRLIADPDSGYAGLSAKLPPMPTLQAGAVDPSTGKPVNADAAKLAAPQAPKAPPAKGA